jgi:superfamily I DNA and/or RNA helicase
MALSLMLKTYLKRLTNLSTRNRSLLLSSLPAEQFIDLHDLDFVDNKSSFEIIIQLITQKKNIRLCDVADARYEKVTEISKRLRKIARTEKFIEEERGSQDLYVGWPFVRGKLSNGTPIHAPLLFFPVSLEQTEKHWQLRRRNETTTLNRSLLLAYAHFNQTQITDELLETNLDDLDSDPLVFRTQLYELLKNSPLEVNFNQDTFQDKLTWFDIAKTTDLELLERNGELKLQPEAILGVFPQAGSYLAPDYEKLLVLDDGSWAMDKLQSQNPKFKIQNYSIPIKESETYTIFAQDASQELALKQVKFGQSLVVQGPPGSGKSQLIANLIADFTARGKRVLVVCQKRVALDVVYERLQKVDVAPFIALIHDFKNDRAALYSQLTKQIEDVEDFKKQNYSLDAVLLERQFLQVSRAIDQVVGELDEFKKALFDESLAGISAKELYLTSNPNEPKVAVDDLFRNFKLNELTNFEHKFNAYSQYTARISPEHAWHERVSFAEFGFSDLQKTNKTINEITVWFEQSGFDFETINKGIKKLPELKNWLDTLKNERVWSFFERLQANDTRLSKIASKFSNVSSVQNLTNISRSETHQIAIKLPEALAARQSWFKWLFYKDKKYFETIVRKTNLSLSYSDLLKLNELINSRLNWEKQVQELEQMLNVNILSESFEESEQQLEKVIFDYETAKKAHLLLESKFSFLKNIIKVDTKNVHQFIKICEQTQLKQANWQQYLTDKQIKNIGLDKDKASLVSTLNADFDLLVESDKIKNSFTATEWQLVVRIFEQNQDNPQQVCQNALRLAWLQYIESQFSILRAVSSLKISQLEADLQQNIRQKQQLSCDILRLKLREQTYQDLEFNRLNNRVSFRELAHQTTKKRKIWPVRKLLENHGDEIFKLVPCWLTSPEAASAIFPLTEGLFDLVVFDEASQCYAEYGIPALYRAKQFVVAGDSKQLSPSDLYRIRFETETDDDNPDLEIDSLLDLVAQYVPQTQLQGHYRSHTLDLIDFSNQHFYQNKLQLLPTFDDAKRHQSAIQYIKVTGDWKNNTNQIEAEKVIELVETLTRFNPNKSIGVVTFNFQQQQLIENLLIAQNAESNTLFVKNIENVQGDERDIIIFSVGYAPDQKGKVRAQFGSLNAQGGENRLNVAITRAKERIYLVTSILPSQLDVENTAHDGPKVFKKYLEYALNCSDGNYKPSLGVISSRKNEWLLKSWVVSNESKVASNSLLTTQDSLRKTLKVSLPFADLTVMNGSDYESLILTDDDLYFEALSAKASHAYLPMQLQEKGWTFERIWSREWWRNLK